MKSRGTRIARVILLTGLSCGFWILACAGESEPPDEAAHEEPVGDEAIGRVAAAADGFGFALLGELWRRDPGVNTFISPTSISIALSMTVNGASGATRDAMMQTLGVAEIAVGDLNRGNNALLGGLGSPRDGVELTTANSLWARKGNPFRDDFVAVNERFYGARLMELDFDDPAAPDAINRWVAEATRDKIDGIIDRIDPMVVLYLINAIYFKGTWSDEFDPKATADRPFTLTDGSTVSCPMMVQTGRFHYYEDAALQAIELPYGDGGTSMYVFLPSGERDLNQLVGNLSSDEWNRLMSGFERKRGTIQLPKFTIEYEKSLKGVLSALGMAVAFEGGADFRAMSPERLYIGDVRHKTYVDVNEEGTEAAAVTAVTMLRASMPEPPEFKMVVDRPFLFAIRDNETGSVLFLGAIVDPTA